MMSGAHATAGHPPMDDTALWLLGRLRDIEREGVFEREPNELLDEMTDGMRADVMRLMETICEWFARMKEG